MAWEPIVDNSVNERNIMEKMEVIIVKKLLNDLSDGRDVRSMFPGLGLDGEKTTPQEVHDIFIKAVTVLDEIGEEGLTIFDDPKGEFAWKDSHVFVIDCSTMKILEHPRKKRIEVDLSNNQDKNSDPAKKVYQNREMCKIAWNPMEGWIDNN